VKSHQNGLEGSLGGALIGGHVRRLCQWSGCLGRLIRAIVWVAEGCVGSAWSVVFNSAASVELLAIEVAIASAVASLSEVGPEEEKLQANVAASSAIPMHIIIE